MKAEGGSRKGEFGSWKAEIRLIALSSKLIG